MSSGRWVAHKGVQSMLGTCGSILLRWFRSFQRTEDLRYFCDRLCPSHVHAFDAQLECVQLQGVQLQGIQLYEVRWE
jgi:hypothetical protein